MTEIEALQIPDVHLGCSQTACGSPYLGEPVVSPNDRSPKVRTSVSDLRTAKVSNGKLKCSDPTQPYYRIKYEGGDWEMTQLKYGKTRGMMKMPEQFTGQVQLATKSDDAGGGDTFAEV